jgi:hypothetical protein
MNGPGKRTAPGEGAVKRNEGNALAVYGARTAPGRQESLRMRILRLARSRPADVRWINPFITDRARIAACVKRKRLLRRQALRLGMKL